LHGGDYEMPSSGMLRCVALVTTDVVEELSASIIRVTRTSELGTTLAVTSNRLGWDDNRSGRTLLPQKNFHHALVLISVRG
jgi:hypothetical protein